MAERPTFAGGFPHGQCILDIQPDRREDGTACAALLLDPVLVPVIARPTKPFQGWRYLAAAAAPADLSVMPAATGAEALPESLRKDLAALGLI